MKLKIAALLLILGSICTAKAQEKEKKKAKTLYCLGQEKEDEFWNGDIYPCPEMNDEQLQAFIKSRIRYPELAKKHFRSSTFAIHLTISAEGKGSLAEMISSGNPEFEDAAISILTDSALKWKPARKNKKSKEMDIWVPVTFTHAYVNGQVYYIAGFFRNFDYMLIDSTNTFPALYVEDNKQYIVHRQHFATPADPDNNKPYGAVTIGFEIDTAGNVTEQKVLTSVSDEIDKIAMNYIEKTSGKWISAHKNGEKVPSYKNFDCLFNDVYKWPSNNIKDRSYASLRESFENNITVNFFSTYTISQDDKAMAMSLLKEKKYKEALIRFDRAAKYYIRDVNLFFNRSVAHYNAGDNKKACDDLQSVMDLAEVEGYPLGITQKQVEGLFVKFCQ